MNECNSALLNLTTLALLALTTFTPRTVYADGGAVDTLNLTDEPGNWFRSEITGTPFTAIRAGQRVDFKINNCCTSTRHAVYAPHETGGVPCRLGSGFSRRNAFGDLRRPGVYLFHCKIIPHDLPLGSEKCAGNIPDVTATIASVHQSSWSQFTACDHRALGYHNNRSHRRRQARKVGYSKFNSASEAEDSRRG